MKHLPDLLIKIYSLLVRLYPRPFRSEFEEQMLLDFADLARDAERQGWGTLLKFCLKELIDFPKNVLWTHLKDGGLIQLLRAQPVDHALRGALGYGVVFGLAVVISGFVSLKLYIEDDSIVGNLQVLYFDLFHTEHGLEFISWLPSAIASLLTGLVLGILFAVLFATRSTYRRFIVAGMLGWFLHDAVRSILWQAANLGFFLGTRQTIYLCWAETLLSGAFLALTFIVAKSNSRESMRLLKIGSFAYPLSAYLSIQLLFKLSIVETPWMFLALMALMTVYICSVFIISLRSGMERREMWIIAAGAFMYVILPYLSHYFVSWVSALIPFPVLPVTGVLADSTLAWKYMFRIALDNSIYGIVFGFFMGSMFGLLPRGNPKTTVV